MQAFEQLHEETLTGVSNRERAQFSAGLEQLRRQLQTLSAQRDTSNTQVVSV